MEQKNENQNETPKKEQTLGEIDSNTLWKMAEQGNVDALKEMQRRQHAYWVDKSNIKDLTDGLNAFGSFIDDLSSSMRRLKLALQEISERRDK